MSKFWSQVVRELEPYVPGEQPQIDGLIKLNTNESPYPPSPEVIKLMTHDAIDRLRLYPDPNSKKLKNTIANYYDVTAEQVFVGNGSDEVLALLFMAFFQQSKPLLFPDISYSFYPVYCKLFGIEYKTPTLRDDFTINFDDYASENGGIIFPNPNAPTAIGKPLAEIEALLQKNTESVVVVDEAYIDFGGETAISLVDKYPNLLVVQTLSKSRSLAGMRVGFAVGNVDLITALDRVKNSFNSYPLDRLAEAATIAAFEDDAYFKACRDKIIATREWTVKQLEALGFNVLPSQANFVFVKPSKNNAAELAQKLREHKILVRYFGAARINEFLRITIGTDEQMQRMVEVLKSA
ncbi:histidinol-phosphate aminotransferase 1 [Cellvibrio zantedeschiae]|uniref:Histidinol-phosphate aminotransferase n=1 Tax=Cellvibrio zantedeschiae TaxID=1237077 RepID=A0ABQ3B940_9GAMM|nr:histidinol-phosphate transaminase [Cellvibrio zantedeschiae]GGY80883.1 histidinol-phosphate aminotransferase 1 [Cellvibrio zantedeschiae]